jgi:hypothetical protein
LRRWTTEASAGRVENGFVRGSTPVFSRVIDIASFAVVEVIFGRGRQVDEGSLKQIDSAILFSKQTMSQLMGEATNPQSTDSIDK